MRDAAGAIRCDVLIMGGGLSSVLAALAIRAAQPRLDVRVLERGAQLGGAHTWSFHDTDLSAEQLARLRPFIVKSWPAQRVCFPGYTRELTVGYHSISSTRFHAVAAAALGDAVMLNAEVASASAGEVRLSTGQRLTANCVLDGRGACASPYLSLAYQSFVGLHLRLAGPHGLEVPVIMDATVPQLGGYRFVYLLPFDPCRVLVEDTYYTSRSGLDEATVRDRIEAYVAARGWQIEAVEHTERGVLPLVLEGDAKRFWSGPLAAPVPIGLRAALFHPVTGYSLPEAVRLADLLGGADLGDTASTHALVRRHALATWRRQGFYRMLNRMLFLAADDEERIAVLARFYHLAQPLVQRFYAGRSTAADQLRILTGRPPIPIPRALRVLGPGAARHLRPALPRATGTERGQA